MYCPKCKSEYVKGITECPECRVQLVYELSEAHYEPKYVEYEELLVTHNVADILIIKSVLDSEGIKYYIKGEYFYLARPWADPARIMVIKDQIDRARELIKDLNIKYTAFPSPDERQDHKHE